ncbi:MAG: YigZ family protein [Clostridia bacterium]|nr:YigZ family protein [Clostridia bacterium]
MATEGYRTPAGFAETELTEKKSRFIAAVKPVATEEEALGFIKERRMLYPDARHHVYAYDVRTEAGEYCRYSDDGEPQGTGGMPVLDVLKKRGLVNAAVVVTRYFGGTLLGAAGLVRAYSGSASMCVDAAGEAEIRLCSRFDISVSYTDGGRVRNYLEDKSGKNDGASARPELLLTGIEYGDGVKFTVLVPAGDAERIKKELTELTSSRLVMTDGDDEYACMNGGQK